MSQFTPMECRFLTMILMEYKQRGNVDRYENLTDTGQSVVTVDGLLDKAIAGGLTREGQ